MLAFKDFYVHAYTGTVWCLDFFFVLEDPSPEDSSQVICAQLDHGDVDNLS